MRFYIFRIIGYAALLSLIILLSAIFFPRTYKVPSLKKRAQTQYWTLRDGSAVGYFLLAGKGQTKKSSIVYLHGGPGGHITDRDIRVFSALSDRGFDIYLYDQIGSGQSQRLKDIAGYTVARHVEDLHEIIGKINSGKIILIGQSWGGILAGSFVARYPEEVEKIIFTCPGPVFPIHQELASLQPPDSFHLRDPLFSNVGGNRLANNIRTKVMAFLATRFNIKLAGDKEADEFATLLSYEVNKSTVCDTARIIGPDAGNGFYASIMTFASLSTINDPRPKMRSLKLPVLVMKGQCDNQPWGFTREYLSLFQNSQLAIIPHAGHFISAEQPGIYVETIEKFINK